MVQAVASRLNCIKTECWVGVFLVTYSLAVGWLIGFSPYAHVFMKSAPPIMTVEKIDFLPVALEFESEASPIFWECVKKEKAFFV